MQDPQRSIPATSKYILQILQEKLLWSPMVPSVSTAGSKVQGNDLFPTLLCVLLAFMLALPVTGQASWSFSLVLPDLISHCKCLGLRVGSWLCTKQCNSINLHQYASVSYKEAIKTAGLWQAWFTAVLRYAPVAYTNDLNSRVFCVFSLTQMPFI